MIRYEPIPLLEATLFLANWAAQISWNTDIEKTFGFCSKSTKQTLEEYSRILTELERRLAAGITVPESTVQTLFAPLHPSDKKANHPSDDYLCHLLLPGEVEAYVEWAEDVFFHNLRKDISNIPKRISGFLKADSQECENDICIQELFAMIKGSDLPQSAKLTLIDLALNPDSYIDMLQETLSPVAEAFRQCRSLVEPLLEEFRASCPEDEATMLGQLTFLDQSKIQTAVICPSVVYSGYSLVALNRDQTVLLFCVGSLYKFLKDHFSLSQGIDVRLTQVLTALGNQNRFNIATKLLDGPAYGRELANHLGISPVTISQHISILMSANLVTVHNDGKRAYYSLNTDELDRFLDLFRKYFRRD